MKAAVVFVCLLVAVTAKPQFGFGFGSGANGFSNAGSIQGQSSGFLGTSQIQQSGANAAVSTMMPHLL